jgi:hypothetical protein
MGDSRYKRVSRTRPCLICGKPDWCSRTSDDSISFCARVTTGADRLSRKEGWGVFYHDRELLNQPFLRKGEPRNFFKPQSVEIASAPLEIRDFIYSTLIRLSPASRFEIITTGAKGLRMRGLTDYANYGSLPSSARERKDLAAQVRILLNQNFTAFVRENPRGIRHIPGFWIDESGEVNLWQKHDYRHPLLLIPYRNPAGSIQACQIRFTGAIRPNQKRYLWLSLPRLESAGSGTPLHFAGWKTFGRTKGNQPILVTEGALKADVAACFLPGYFTLASGGVSCSHELIVNLARGKSLMLAFDNDYQDNPAVLRQLAKLLKLRLQTGIEQETQDSTKILGWSRAEKGIDDALAKGEKIYALKVGEWFSALEEDARAVVRKVWAEG